MTITEPARHRMYEKLEGLMGMDDASTLMAHLPPVGWADVATHADLDQLHDRIRIDLADIRIEMADLRTEMADLRTEMADLRTDLRTEMADLRTEMADLRTEFRTEFATFRDEIHRDRLMMQRQLMFVVIAAVLSLLGTIASMT